MTLVAHFDLELRKIDMKTNFLNQDFEEVYMTCQKVLVITIKILAN
jgi:hypothetical protein